MNTKIKIALLAIGLAGSNGSAVQAKMEEIIGKKQVCNINQNQCDTQANRAFCGRLRDDSYSPSCYAGRCVCMN